MSVLAWSSRIAVEAVVEVITANLGVEERRERKEKKEEGQSKQTAWQGAGTIGLPIVQRGSLFSNIPSGS